HDGEVCREPRRFTELTQEAMSYGMERASLHSGAGGAHEPFGAREHLARGATGEREKEDSLGRDAALDEIGDAMDQGARLSGARAGDDEQRRVAECDGARLIRVERRGDPLLVRGSE